MPSVQVFAKETASELKTYETPYTLYPLYEHEEAPASVSLFVHPYRTKLWLTSMSILGQFRFRQNIPMNGTHLHSTTSWTTATNYARSAVV